MTLPNRIYAGDTVEFGVNVPDYLPEDDWTLKLRIAPRFTSPVQAAVTLTATDGPYEIDDESFDYAITASPSTTENWAAGQYAFAFWVEKAGARVTLEGTQYQGELTILQNVATMGATQGVDMRSQAQKALDYAQQALADAQQRAATIGTSTASGAVVEYRIGDRMVKYSNAQEAQQAVTTLLAVISHLKWEVKREKRAEALAKGLPDPRKTYVRMERG